MTHAGRAVTRVREPTATRPSAISWIACAQHRAPISTPSSLKILVSRRREERWRQLAERAAVRDGLPVNVA